MARRAVNQRGTGVSQRLAKDFLKSVLLYKGLVRQVDEQTTDLRLLFFSGNFRIVHNKSLKFLDLTQFRACASHR